MFWEVMSWIVVVVYIVIIDGLGGCVGVIVFVVCFVSDELVSILICFNC